MGKHDKIRRNKKLLFVVFLLITDIVSWAYIILKDSAAINRYFVANANFSDFFSPMQKLRINAYDSPHFSNYPPLANIIFLIIKKFGATTDGLEYRDDTAIGIIFVLFLAGSILTIYEIGKKYLKNDGMMLNVLCILLIMVSGPFLFLYSRGNNLLYVIPMIMFFVKYYDSENKYLQELACVLLAVATALKIYPVFFGLLLIKKEKKMLCIRTCIYGAIAFFVPFLVFGLDTINKFISNLLKREAHYAVNHIIGLKGSIQVIGGFLFNKIIWSHLNVCWLLALFALFYVFFMSKEEWKRIFAVTMISIWIFKGSFLYNICLLVIPLLIFLEVNNSKMNDYIYTVLFGILFSTMFLPDTDNLNILLEKNSLGHISGAMIVIETTLILMVGIIFLDTAWEKIKIIIFTEEKCRMEQSQFDAVAETYDTGLKELLGKYGGEDTEKFTEYKIAHIRKVLKCQPQTILDFGCGTGRSLEYIQKYFPQAKIYGCDVSKESLKIAATIIPEEKLFVNESVESLKQAGVKFDLVIAACVFHHIAPNDRAYWINGIKNVLSSEGHFAVYEHNAKNPITRKIILDANNKVDDINWMLSHKELLNLMGEDIFWHGYTLFSPVRFKGILGMEGLLKWLPVGAQHCVIT